MKFPLEWHQTNLKNSSIYLKKELDSLEKNFISTYNRIYAGMEEDKFRQSQIDTAIKKGMNGFDNEKFMGKELKELKARLQKIYSKEYEVFIREVTDDGT
jgi:hypothetical protein